MQHKASASINLVQLLFKFAQDRQIDSTSLAHSIGLSSRQLENPEARISAAQLYQLWEELALRADDTFLGLHVGSSSAGLPAGQITSLIMLNSPIVGVAIEKLARYHDLALNFIKLELLPGERFAYLRWRPVADLDIQPNRHHAEAVMATLSATLRNLVRDQNFLLEVRFQHRAPQKLNVYQQVFACPVRFGQQHHELVLTAQMLSRPLPLADPELLQTLEAFAQKKMAQLDPAESWTEMVTQQMSEILLSGNKPSLRLVASQLTISDRHLQNKLQAEGNSYRQLLDQVRHEMALDYLQRPDFSLYDLAFLLGFSEQSAFNHAFKRWTGSKPSDYRKTARLGNRP